MKVLHLSSETSWRGGEQQIAYLIEELNKLGIDNTVACRTGSAFEAYCKEQGWKHYSLPFKNSLDVKSAAGVKKICLSESIDLVHMHSSKSHGIGWLAGLLGNKTPLILSRRVEFPPKTNFITRKKYNYHRIRKILCVSEAIKRVMLRYIQEEEKCATVYSGIDLEKFKGNKLSNTLRSEYKIPSDQLLIGNISAISPEKDYYTFVETAGLVLSQGIAAKFLIIGSGSEEKAIKSYVEAKGLSDHMIFTGFRKDLVQVLPELDLFLMTSAIEGLGTSLLDAFACKVPVVATRAGGMPEIVKHQETGLSAPVKDPVSLAEQVVRMAQNQALRQQLVTNAYEFVKSFDKKQTALQTLKHYWSVLAEKR